MFYFLLLKLVECRQRKMFHLKTENTGQNDTYIHIYIYCLGGTKSKYFLKEADRIDISSHIWGLQNNWRSDLLQVHQEMFPRTW